MSDDNEPLGPGGPNNGKTALPSHFVLGSRMEALLASYAHAAKHEGEAEGEKIHVSELMRKAASVYETLRNTIEYAEQHLLRRNAIRRILARRLSSEADLKMAAEELLHELIWARYLSNDGVSVHQKQAVLHILEKYKPLFTAAEEHARRREFGQWLLDMVSTEVEHLLAPPAREEALASFAYATMKEHVEWGKRIHVKEEERDLQLYIAIYRSLLRSNQATMRYRVFHLFYPTWPQANQNLIEEVASHLELVVDTVEAHLRHPAGDLLTRLLRRKIVLFKILHDVLTEKPESLEHEDTKAFMLAIEKAAKNRMHSVQSRLLRSVFRAVVFLFFTKLVLAFIVELPYEVLVIHEDNYVPLLVNVLFHPFLLAVLAFSGSNPTKKNTELLKESVFSMVTDGAALSLDVKIKKSWQTGAFGKIFPWLYMLTFLVSYGLITTLLVSLHFNLVSIILFLLFLSLVMFLGINIRASRKELVVVPGSGGALSVLSDFFTLPIIRAGRWMTIHAPRINVMLFFLDFVIEAPFKMAIQIIEGWIAFMKEKREEIE